MSKFKKVKQPNYLKKKPKYLKKNTRMSKPKKIPSVKKRG